MLGENHEKLGDIYFYLGVANQNLVKNKRALIYFEFAQKIYKSTLGLNHPNLAETYLKIGTTLMKLKEFNKATEFFELYQKIKR